jgi:hypothetical protein
MSSTASTKASSPSYPTPSPQHHNQATAPPTHVIPLPTQKPRPAPPQVSYVDSPATDKSSGFDNRQGQDRPTPPPPEVLDLHEEVKRAMQYIFPHDLLSIYQNRLYLPPLSPNQGQVRVYLPPPSPMGQLPNDIKYQLQGVFPHELFAMSHYDLNGLEQLEDYPPRSGLSANRGSYASGENQQAFTQQRQQQWDINVNRKTGNPGTSVKTAPQSNLQQRFGDDSGNGGDRLVFTP